MTNQPAEHASPKKPRRWLRVLIAVVAAFAAAALLLTGVYYWLYTQGRLTLRRGAGDISAPESMVDAVEDDGMTVQYRGASYRYNEDVVSVLFLGVDKKTVSRNEGYGRNGQADSLFLAAIDTKSGAVRILPLTRESMVDVDIIGVGGGYAGVEKTQLCLAYAYGATGDESCRNVARSVSRLLYGVPVDAYVAIDLQGVKTLTNAVGGVPVTALETFQAGNFSFVQGQKVTLKGNNAEAYIRYRKDSVDGNSLRMKRQQQFLEAFFQKAKSQIKSNFTVVGTYYNTAKPYIVSNLTLSQITYLAGSGLTSGDDRGIEYISITGETVKGEKFVEFYPDATSTYEAVLAAFYTRVEE